MDTFGPGDTTGTGASAMLLTGGPLATSAWADMRFTTPFGGPVQTVTFAVNTTPPLTTPLAFNVVLSADNAGVLASELETISVPATTVTPSPVVITVASVGHPVLAAGTAYWVGLRLVTNTSCSWSPGANASVGSPTYRTCTSGLTGTHCITPTGIPPAVRVTVLALGACCALDTTCIVMSGPQCSSFRGTYRGNDTTCADPCPPTFPQGACCRAGMCAAATSLGCAFVVGHFLGENSTCTPANGVNPCCAADFNNSGSPTVQDIFDFLSAWFRGCP